MTSARELLAVIDAGQQRRHVSSTQMNRESSRSHLVMSVIIEATNLQTQNVTKGKLSFVDLAGSERCAVGFAHQLIRVLCRFACVGSRTGLQHARAAMA